MGEFVKKPVVIEAITFDELVKHGLENGANVVDGMPWSWYYNGHPITHENNTVYLIPTLEGTMRMTPNDMLITGVKGEIYPCKKEIFEATYSAVDVIDENKELTFGQKAVGLRFNPSGWSSVDNCKQKFADLIDDMNDYRNDESNSLSTEARRHASIAITELESAQMRAVKALTWVD